MIGSPAGLLRGAIALILIASTVSSCGWRGLNSLPMPGTQGRGAGAFEVQVQMPDVTAVEQNSRVRIGDVNVGTVTGIERQDWHALVTMSLNSDVDLPANATAKVGQTSIFGSPHIELAAPTNVAPEGHLRNGSVIPLAASGTYPTTERTLAAVSLLLNGGGVANVQDIAREFNSALAGREQDLRSLLDQLDQFIGKLDGQTGDIIAATESLNNLVGQIAEQKPVLDRALHIIPDALGILSEQRHAIADALDKFGRFSALTADVVHQTKDNLIRELSDLGPVLQSLSDAGPALTRSLSLLLTFPWPEEVVRNAFRGDAANLTLVVDLTLSRLDSAMFTGTRFEGDLTALEMQWGRTIGQIPSPYTAGNPLIIPYRLDQGP